MRAPLFSQATVQAISLGDTGFQSEYKGMGQIETGRINILCQFSLIRSQRIQAHQSDIVTGRVRIQQGPVQFGPVHDLNTGHNGIHIPHVSLAGLIHPAFFDLSCNPMVEIVGWPVHRGRKPTTVKQNAVATFLHTFDHEYIFFEHGFPQLRV